MAVHPGGHGGHQARPDHGTVGLVEELVDVADPGARVVLVGQRRQSSAADHGRPAGDGGEPRRPQSGLLDLALVADPLRLDAVGHQRVGDAWGDLDAGAAGEQRLDERPGRCPVVGAEAPASAAAPRRVGVRRAERRHVQRRRVGDADRTAEPERSEVGAGHLDPQRVEVDPGRGQAGPGEGDQVATDAAGQVDHARSGDRDAGGTVVGDGGARGLLQAVAGEVHPSRVVAQLRRRVRAELDLAERRRHLLRRRALPQPALHLQGGALGRRRCREQRLTLVGQQPPERLEVHLRILAARCGRELGAAFPVSSCEEGEPPLHMANSPCEAEVRHLHMMKPSTIRSRLGTALPGGQ